MLIIQAFLICILLTTIVKIAVGNDAVNGAYFYPKEIQQRLIELGRTDQKTISRKRKICMTSFYVVLPVAMLLIIGCWNGVSDFKKAYLQALLFLEVMNWYDGFIIDKLWVGCSKFWKIPGTEDLPFVQSWGQMFKKRCILTVIWIAGAALVAGLVVLIF